MDLARDKKGMELSTIIEIILVVVGSALIIGVFTLASNKADEKHQRYYAEDSIL